MADAPEFSKSTDRRTGRRSATAKPAAKPAAKSAAKSAAKAKPAAPKRDEKAAQARLAAEYKALWKSVAKAPPLPEPWNRLLDDALRRSPQLGALAASIRQLAVPSLAFQEAPTRAAPVGGSRVGGCPDLPAGTAWPIVDGERLSFLVQLNLADVPPAIRGNLPTRGLLSVFLGRVEGNAAEHRAMLLETRRLGRAGAPHADSPWRDPKTGLLEPVRLVPSPMVSLPGPGSIALGALAEKWGKKDLMAAYLALRQSLTPKGDLTRIWGWSETPNAPGREGHVFLSIASHKRAKLVFAGNASLEIESQGATAPGKTKGFLTIVA